MSAFRLRIAGKRDMGRVGKILLLSAFVAYPILLHTFILKGDVDTSLLLLVFAPLLLVVAWVSLRMVGKLWWPLLGLLFGLGVYYVATGDHGRIGLLAVNGLSHATTNLFLLWVFGRTLLPQSEPLLSQISRKVHGWLDPDVVDYTRHATIAWCVFFVLQVLVSLLLYVFAPLAAWSFFINVLNLPLLLLMFVGENAYRTTHFPNHPRASMLKVIEVYSRDFSAAERANSKH